MDHRSSTCVCGRAGRYTPRLLSRKPQPPAQGVACQAPDAGCEPHRQVEGASEKFHSRTPLKMLLNPKPEVGVSANRGPKYTTLNNRILTPTSSTLIFGNSQVWYTVIKGVRSGSRWVVWGFSLVDSETFMNRALGFRV